MSDAIRPAAEALVHEHCREWLAGPTVTRCNQPADFVLWGMMLKPEALGPRCYDHAAKHVGHDTLGRKLNGSDGYQLEAAIMDLRPLRRALREAAESAVIGQ